MQFLKPGCLSPDRLITNPESQWAAVPQPWWVSHCITPGYTNSYNKNHYYGGEMEGIKFGQKNKLFSNPVGLLGVRGMCSERNPSSCQIHLQNHCSWKV